MTEKTLTTENIKPAIDALRGELAPWPVVAMKQDKLNNTQKSAVNSGITSGLVAQIIANTAAIRALESAITGTGLRPLVVASLPAIGTQGILYIVPVTTYDPATDADVVNYSNEYIWIVAPDAPVTEGYYEQVGQTGIVINNGQLNITVNGTSVGTFTANQAGDTTAAITVPTNADYVDRTTAQSAAGVKTFSDGIVSNVTGNVTGDLTGTASRAIADEDGNSIKTGYGKLAGSQTWTGNNTFTGNTFLESAFVRNTAIIPGNTPSSAQTITQTYAANSNATLGYSRVVLYDTGVTTFEVATRNKFSNGALDPSGTYTESKMSVGLDNTGLSYFSITGKVKNSLTPFTNSTYSLGSSSYQWSAVYAQTYYYNGAAWGLDKANVWSQNQSVTNAVTPKFILQDTRNDRTYSASTTLSGGVMRWECDDKDGAALSRISTTLRSDKVVQLQLAIFNEDSTGTEFDRTIRFAVGNTGSAVYYPEQTGNVDLGDSSHKWKTLNGINPGALSLPDASNSVNIDTTGWVTDGSAWNTITSSNLIDGYLYINYSMGSADDYISVRLRTSNYQNPTFCVPVNTTRLGNHYLYVCVPVSKLFDVFLEIKTTGTLQKACIFPMLGNV